MRVHLLYAYIVYTNRVRIWLRCVWVARLTDAISTADRVGGIISPKINPEALRPRTRGVFENRVATPPRKILQLEHAVRVPVARAEQQTSATNTKR